MPDLTVYGFDSLPGSTANEYDCVEAPTTRLVEFFPYPGAMNYAYPRANVYEFDYHEDRFSFEKCSDSCHKVCKVRAPS